MTKIDIHEGLPKVDSLRLQFTLPHGILSLGHYLEENHYDVGNSGTIYNETSKQKFEWIDEQSHTTIHFKHSKNLLNNTPDILEITASAKLLCEKYFEGFNSENLFNLYASIQRCPHAPRFSYEQMLNAKPKDVDIAIDFVTTHQAYTHAINQIDQLTKPEAVTYREDFKNEKQGKLQGRAFNKRKTATTSLQHIKIYPKTREIISKAQTFSQSFSQSFRDELPEIARYEVTFKNSEHWSKHITFAPKTIKELFDIPLTQHKESFINALNKSYLIREKTAMKNTDDRLEDMMLEDVFQLTLINFDKDHNKAKEHLLNRMKSRCSKGSASDKYQRFRKKLEKIIATYLEANAMARQIKLQEWEAENGKNALLEALHIGPYSKD